MQFQSIMDSIGSLGASLLAPAKTIIVTLAQIMIQLMQYTISLLHLLISKI